jgi:hypothetical protein
MEDDKGGKKNSPDEVEVLRKKVARPSSKPDPNIVELNVGGMLFTTTLSTLTKDPSSMLFSMFSGKWKTVCRIALSCIMFYYQSHLTAQHSRRWISLPCN